MKKIIFIFLSFIMALSTVNAQKGIGYNVRYATGGRLNMAVDSAAKNVYYGLRFPNQPNTSFNYLPDVDSVNIQVYFRKKDSVAHYRYTILADDKPIAVNKSINKAELKEVLRPDDNFVEVVIGVFDSTSLGIFPIKDKTLTILTYDIQSPQDVYKTVFYGKPIPKAKIELVAKRFATEFGVDYSHIGEPKERIDITFTEKDEELTIVKESSDIDYLYSTSIKDKKTDKIIFESTSWIYGGYSNEAGKSLPYVKIDRNIFKKSGDYEIIIQPLIKWDREPNGPLKYDISREEIETYTARYTLAITLDQESYTKKELLTYTLLAVFSLGLIFLIILYFTRKRNEKRLAEKERQKNTAKLQLSSIRSQLNPHFLFNALAGIQNLMNKNEIDNANKYLSKFARLTRNVLDDKEMISLSEERDLLNDYLQMEQLRFSFNYEIDHSRDIDLANIEIPGMLLQPFVENAVKHGVSQKANDAKIIIAFIKQEKDLVLTVWDNGQGFDPERKDRGLGLPLSESRIALLNSIHKENRFTLAIQSSTDGTTITLTLTDWL